MLEDSSSCHNHSISASKRSGVPLPTRVSIPAKRPYGQEKTHGLIVDYLGVFDDVAQALEFDEEGIMRLVSNIVELKAKLPEAIQKCLEYFPGVNRSVSGYERLIVAQDCLPNNDVRDRFARDCSYLARLWEAVSPDPILNDHETDYRSTSRSSQPQEPWARLASPWGQDDRANSRERERRDSA